MYNKLILSGGGKRGILHLGSLQYIYENIDVTNINTYIGTSIGTIICYFLILEYTPVELMTILCTSKLMNKFKEPSIVSFLNGQSVFTTDFIHKFLIQTTLNKTSSLFTLKQLYDRYNKELICTTYNVTKNKIEYISYKNYPDLSCIKAIKMSSNIPFLFNKIENNGSYYVDGAFANNFPINLVSNNDKVISINVTLKEVKITDNVLTYLHSILCSLVYHNVKYNINRYKTGNTIIINMCDIGIMNNNIDCNAIDIMNIFCYAYEYTRIYYDKKLK